MKPIEELINEAVTEYFSVSLRDIKGKSRKIEIVKPRHICMYFCKEFTGYSLAKIGWIYNKDHATVLQGIRSVNNQIDTYINYRIDILTLRDKIKDKLFGVKIIDDIFQENDFYTGVEPEEQFVYKPYQHQFMNIEGESSKVVMDFNKI